MQAHTNTPSSSQQAGAWVHAARRSGYERWTTSCTRASPARSTSCVRALTLFRRLIGYVFSFFYVWSVFFNSNLIGSALVVSVFLVPHTDNSHHQPTTSPHPPTMPVQVSPAVMAGTRTCHSNATSTSLCASELAGWSRMCFCSYGQQSIVLFLWGWDLILVLIVI